MVVTSTAKATPRRHRNPSGAPPNKTVGIASLKRLARRGGVKRIAGTLYPEVHDILVGFIREVVKNAVVFAEYSRRKTITTTDVVYALKRAGFMTLYGYNEATVTRRARSVTKPPALESSAWAVATTTAPPSPEWVPTSAPVRLMVQPQDAVAAWNTTASPTSGDMGSMALRVTDETGTLLERETVRSLAEIQDTMRSVQACKTATAAVVVTVGNMFPLFEAGALAYPLWLAVVEANRTEALACALQSLYASHHITTIVADETAFPARMLAKALATLAPSTDVYGHAADLNLVLLRTADQSGVRAARFTGTSPVVPAHVSVQICLEPSPTDALAVALRYANDERPVGLIAAGHTVEWVRRTSAVFWDRECLPNLYKNLAHCG